jgi:hypothetical protein
MYINKYLGVRLTSIAHNNTASFSRTYFEMFFIPLHPASSRPRAHGFYLAPRYIPLILPIRSKHPVKNGPAI